MKNLFFTMALLFGCFILSFAKSKTNSIQEENDFLSSSQIISYTSLQKVKFNNKNQECVEYADNVVNFFEHENSSLSSAELMEIHDRAYSYCMSQK